MLEDIRQEQLKRIAIRRKKKRERILAVLSIVVVLIIVALTAMLVISKLKVTKSPAADAAAGTKAAEVQSSSEQPETERSEAAQKSHHESSSADFTTTRYALKSDKLNGPLKLVVMSDLHDAEFGEDNSQIIEMVRAEEPDMVCMLGDMINKEDTDVYDLKKLCSSLIEICPVYFSFGNHETTAMFGRLDSLQVAKELADVGVIFPEYGVVELEKGDDTVLIGATSTSEENYDRYAAKELMDFWKSDSFKVFLSHYPSLYYEKLKDCSADIALAGHYHGGQIQLPKFGPLYHIDTGFFPQYGYGEFDLANGKLFVTSGLGNHSVIPRINNDPEVVVISVN